MSEPRSTAPSHAPLAEHAARAERAAAAAAHVASGGDATAAAGLTPLPGTEGGVLSRLAGQTAGDKGNAAAAGGGGFTLVSRHRGKEVPPASCV